MASLSRASPTSASPLTYAASSTSRTLQAIDSRLNGFCSSMAS